MEKNAERHLLEKYWFLRPRQNREVVENNLEIMAKESTPEQQETLDELDKTFGTNLGKINEKLKQKQNPSIYGKKLEPIYDLMVFGLEVGDGWIDLLDKLCYKINKHLDSNLKLKEGFRVDQVKSKYGTLRFYTSGEDDYIFNLIKKYEKLSGKICERCGKAATMCIRGGWFATLCSDCAKKEGFITLKEHEAFIKKAKKGWTEVK